MTNHDNRITFQLREMAQKARISGGKFDIVNALTKAMPGREFHITDQDNDGTIKKASFCGPGTMLKERLENFNPETGEYDKIITDPINYLDLGCMKHDIAYGRTNEDLSFRHDADRELLKHAEQVINDPSATSRQRLMAKVVWIVMRLKLMAGVGFCECCGGGNINCECCGGGNCSCGGNVDPTVLFNALDELE